MSVYNKKDKSIYNIISLKTHIPICKVDEIIQLYLQLKKEEVLNNKKTIISKFGTIKIKNKNHINFKKSRKGWINEKK